MGRTKLLDLESLIMIKTHILIFSCHLVLLSVYLNPLADQLPLFLLKKIFKI